MGRRLVVKGYQVGAQIEQEGLRTIHHGRHIQTGTPVFITVVACRPGRSQNILLHRAEQSKMLQFPGLLTAMDCGVLVDGRFYYTQHARSTEPATSYLESCGSEGDRLFEGVGLVIRALDILDYIHRAHTAHRDISTQCLRVAPGRHVYLDGFINARPRIEPRQSLSLLPSAYISPEQLMGCVADAKTDIYAMGIVLYELVTRTLPYESNYAKLEDAREGRVPNPARHKMDLPGDLEIVIMTALSARKERYSSCMAFQDALSRSYRKRSLRLKIKDLSTNLVSVFSRR